jgi:hypothetical protein
VFCAKPNAAIFVTLFVIKLQRINAACAFFRVEPALIKHTAHGFNPQTCRANALIWNDFDVKTGFA